MSRSDASHIVALAAYEPPVTFEVPVTRRHSTGAATPPACLSSPPPGVTPTARTGPSAQLSLPLSVENKSVPAPPTADGRSPQGDTKARRMSVGIEPGLAAQIRVIAAAEGTTIGRVVDQSLRLALPERTARGLTALRWVSDRVRSEK